MENGILELIQLLNRTQEVRRHCPSPDGLVMQKGKLKSLFQTLIGIIKKVKEEAEKESLEETRNRKLELDNNLIRGQKYLENKNLKDAEEAFQEAVNNYVDEHKLFYVIGSKLLEAGFPKQALTYLTKGLKVDPDPLIVAIASARAWIALEEWDKAEAALLEHAAAAQATHDPDLFALLAQAQARQGKAREALKSAAQGLQADPGHKASRMIYNKLKKAAAKKAAPQTT